MQQAKVYGVTPSPYVRKVLVAMIENDIDYQLITQMPFQTTPEFLAKSPLGKIPCYEDEHITVAESSCILAYLDKRYSHITIYPSDPAEFAMCCWFEKYADSTLSDVVLVPFFQRIIKPKFFEQSTDHELVTKVLNEKLPIVFDYLEQHSPEQDYLFGAQLSAADIAIGSVFVNFFYSGEQIDAQQWPKLAAYVQRLHQRDSFTQLMTEDAKLL